VTYQPPQTYNQLHFAEYLEGGQQTPLLFNWGHLQGDLPARTEYHFKLTDSKAYKPSLVVGYALEDEREKIKAYSHCCQQLLGQKLVAIEFPGGMHRSSFRLTLENGHSVIASRRFNAGRSFYESLVMRRLEKHQAPIPKHYAYNGLVMIQEELSGVRLSDALQNCSEEQYVKMMSSALDALLEIHEIAEKEKLSEVVPIIGCEHDWLIAFIDRTALLGNYMGIPTAKIPVKQIYDCLMLLKPRFIKWDARPGNAMLGDDGKVKWFDWEHCCARNPMDDMAWLLCDDAVPNYPEAEDQLIDTYLAAFADGRKLDEARVYLDVFGMHHACVRLCRILNEKDSDSWLAYENSISVQHGSPLRTAQQLCKRASRWAGKNPMTASLAEWFLQIAKRLPRV